MTLLTVQPKGVWVAESQVTHVHLERSMKFGFARFEEETSSSTSNQTNPTREICIAQLGSTEGKTAALQMGSVEFLHEKVEMRCGSKAHVPSANC